MKRIYSSALAVITGCIVNPAFDAGSTGGNATTSAGTEPATGDATEGDVAPLGEVCAPLAPPTGEVVTVGPEDVATLGEVIAQAAEGSTIVFEPGTYALTSGMYVQAPGLTIRSATGNPGDVILDGAAIDQTIFLVQAADVTVAEMTLRRGGAHQLHFGAATDRDVRGGLAYRLRFEDPTLDSFKANDNDAGHVADDGVLACSTFTLGDAYRATLGDTCSPRAIQGYGAAGWHIRDNRVEGFWCPAGGSSAISFAEGSADHVIERNVIVDANVGIRLGLYENRPEGVRVIEGPVECGDVWFDHYGGIVRNNMIIATSDAMAASQNGFYAGVAMWQVCGTTVVHNTVVSTMGAAGSIEYRFTNTQAKVLNNLVTDQFRERDEAVVPAGGNLQVEDLSAFVDPVAGDAHLVPGSAAIDAGVMLGEDDVIHDIDGEVRRGLPDIGADEA